MADDQSMNIKIEAKPDFLKSLASNVSPITAVSELIWNGFDAGAQHVKVILEPNELTGLHAIRVSDDGDGIDRGEVNALFGGLGDSWKAKSRRYKGRTLHGKNGKGRFRAFALGESVEWRTTYLDGTAFKTYTINGRASQLTGFSSSQPTDADTTILGTEVFVENLHSNFPSLTSDKATLEITKQFAAYLTESPGLTLYYNGEKIDPASVQNYKEDLNLGEVELQSGKRRGPLERPRPLPHLGRLASQGNLRRIRMGWTVSSSAAFWRCLKSYSRTARPFSRVGILSSRWRATLRATGDIASATTA